MNCSRKLNLHVVTNRVRKCHTFGNDSDCEGMMEVKRDLRTTWLTVVLNTHHKSE